MEMEREKMYAAYKAKDARFDGRFFVGISSTGIYCRPICRARLAKPENCTFFATAAEAELAGYRPCLLCRPEQSPGRPAGEPSSRALADRAARLMEADCGAGRNLEELAAELGCTSRHLRRVFAEEFHVTPVQYLKTCRLLLAKSLLTDTELSVLDTAMASGFQSLRRFQDAFKEQYRMTPTDLRKQVSEKKKEKKDGSITVCLSYRPPYRYEELLRFFAERAIPGVEIVKDGRYYRTARVKDAEGRRHNGWFSVGHEPEKNALSVKVGETLLPVLSQILGRVRGMFDLSCDPETVACALSGMEAVRPGLFKPGTRVPGSFDAFELSVRAVLGQQIAVRAACTLAGRLAEALGTPVFTGIEGLSLLFPEPEEFLSSGEPLESRLGPLGILSSRSAAIKSLAEAFTDGSIRFGFCADPEAEMKKLLKIRGIGNWTAQYIAMRTMAWTDAFLETDAGIKKALPGLSPKELLKLAEPWRPWRSYANMCLWNSLYGEEKTECM